MPPKKRSAGDMGPPPKVPKKAVPKSPCVPKTGLLKPSSFASYESWKEVVVKESRVYYTTRSEAFFRRQWERVNACLSHEDCGAFQLTCPVSKGKTFWAYNAKETCDKFENFLTEKKKVLTVKPIEFPGSLLDKEGSEHSAEHSDPEDSKIKAAEPEAASSASSSASALSSSESTVETNLGDDKNQKVSNAGVADADIAFSDTIPATLEMPEPEQPDQSSVPETLRALDMAKDHKLFQQFLKYIHDTQSEKYPASEYQYNFGQPLCQALDDLLEFNQFLEGCKELPLDLTKVHAEHKQEEDALATVKLMASMENDLVLAVTQACQHYMLNGFLDYIAQQDQAGRGPTWSFGRGSDPVKDLEDFNLFLKLKHSDCLKIEHLLPLKGLAESDNPLRPIEDGTMKPLGNLLTKTVEDMNQDDVDELCGEALHQAIETCKEHRLFPQFKEYMIQTHGLEEQDLEEFGHNEPELELKDFLGFLSTKALLDKKGSGESSPPKIAVPSLPTEPLLSELARSEVQVVMDVEFSTARKNGHQSLFSILALNPDEEHQLKSSIQLRKRQTQRRFESDMILKATSMKRRLRLTKSPQETMECRASILDTYAYDSSQFSLEMTKDECEIEIQCKSLQAPKESSPKRQRVSRECEEELESQSLNEFLEENVDSFLSGMPSCPDTSDDDALVAELPQTLEEADLHLAKTLSQYPDLGDLTGCTAKVMAALLMKHHFSTPGSSVLDNLRNQPSTMRVGSICSGTGAFEVCLEALQTHLVKPCGHSDFEVKPRFVSEHVKFKAEFCKAHTGVGDDCCMFKDALLLKDDENRYCTTHETSECELPALDGFMAGFSCTSYSPLNSNCVANATAMERAQKSELEAKVASVDTFNACIHVLKTSRPKWSVLENVQTIDREVDKDTKTNLEVCLDMLKQIGYAAQSFLLDAMWFGLPQSRKRIYIVCLDVQSDALTGNAVDFYNSVKLLLGKLYIKAPPADSFLLPDDCPAVVNYLTKLQARGDSKEEKEKEGGTSWINMHMNIAGKRNIQWPLEIPKCVTSSKWFKVLTARAKEVLGFAADDKYRQGKLINYCDIYHSATRYSTGDQFFPIVLPRTIGWSFLRQRLILGRECLLMQGQSLYEETDGRFTEQQLQDLSGNAFAANVVLAVLVAVLGSLRHASPSETEENDEINDLVYRMTRH